MRILYQLVSALVLWLLPLVIVFYAIVWTVANPQVYLQAFRGNDFYEQISTLAKENADFSEFKAQDGIAGFVLASILKDFSPDQWQDFIEGNVTVITDWLRGDEENLVFYIPTEGLEVTLSKNLDENINKLIEENSANLPVCNQNELSEIERQGGFDPEKSFCLPPSVQSGEQSLSEFLGAGQNETLENLLQNNYLSLQRNRYAADTINTPVQIQDFINGPLNSLRDGFLLARSWTPVVLIASLVTIAGYVALAWMSKKEVVAELAKLGRGVGINLLITSAVVMLILGGTYYLNATILSLISPVLALGEIANLILWTVLNIAFNLVSPAVWLGGFGLVVWMILSLVAKRQRQKFQAKNDQILNYQPDHARNQTFNSQFQQAVSETQPQSQPATATMSNQPTPSEQSVTIDDPSPQLAQTPELAQNTNYTDPNLNLNESFPPEYLQNTQPSTAQYSNQSVNFDGQIQPTSEWGQNQPQQPTFDQQPLQPQQTSQVEQTPSVGPTSTSSTEQGQQTQRKIQL